MKAKHLITANGRASSWDNVATHHKYHRAANRMVEIPCICRFAESCKLPELKFNDDGSAKMSEQTYFDINNEWVTTQELEALRSVGVSPTVTNVELQDLTWTVAIENPLVRVAFIGWNIVLGLVLLNQGGVL